MKRVGLPTPHSLASALKRLALTSELARVRPVCFYCVHIARAHSPNTSVLRRGRGPISSSSACYNDMKCAFIASSRLVSTRRISLPASPDFRTKNGRTTRYVARMRDAVLHQEIFRPYHDDGCILIKNGIIFLCCVSWRDDARSTLR